MKAAQDFDDGSAAWQRPPLCSLVLISDIAGTLTTAAGPIVTTQTGTLGDALTSYGDIVPTATPRWNQGVNNPASDNQINAGAANANFGESTASSVPYVAARLDFY